ncbi:hypothetical protein Tco_0429740 [Tanacetum coccineum]
MVACLERSDENAEFHQIVDFLTTSSIHYALTQIHATVDGKTVVISESSVRSDLHFNDEDGITCLSNDEIFVNLALMGELGFILSKDKFHVSQGFYTVFNNRIALAEPFNDIYVTPVHTKKSLRRKTPHSQLVDQKFNSFSAKSFSEDVRQLILRIDKVKFDHPILNMLLDKVKSDVYML